MVLVLADAAAFADLHRHRAADHVARGEVLRRRRIALHEALALRIDEIAALAARALGDEAARAVDAGRVELHELHILQRQARAQRHRVAVAGAGMGRGRGEIGAAVAAGRQDRRLGAEAVDRAVVHLQADDAAERAFRVADEIDGEIFDEELAARPQRLAVERVQHRVAGAVGGGAGALRDALAVIGRHAAERPLVDLALFGARERHAPVLELIDGVGRVAAQIFDRVLVAEPVGALHGVVHVPAPVVRPHIAERGGDAALRRDRVRAGRKDFGDAGGAQARLRAADAGAQARAARADDDDVEGVVGRSDRLCRSALARSAVEAPLADIRRASSQVKARRKVAKRQANAISAQNRCWPRAPTRAPAPQYSPG